MPKQKLREEEEEALKNSGGQQQESAPESVSSLAMSKSPRCPNTVRIYIHAHAIGDRAPAHAVNMDR